MMRTRGLHSAMFLAMAGTMLGSVDFESALTVKPYRSDDEPTPPVPTKWSTNLRAARPSDPERESAAEAKRQRRAERNIRNNFKGTAA